MSKIETPVIKPFNPLDKYNLGESVADALLATPAVSLPPFPFIGAGVYAVYYIGTLKIYKHLAEQNQDSKFALPIYVGKAVPAGARKGGLNLSSNCGKTLYKRLSQHAESINMVDNLDVKDFYCRFLVIDDIWIPLAESVLIEKFKPVWNVMLDGFGNHAPGKGRDAGMKPQWDTIHPGRIQKHLSVF